MNKPRGEMFRNLFAGFRRQDPSSIRGYLETVTSAAVSGWAFDPEDPQAPVNVRVVVDEQVIGEGRADIPRPDTGREHSTNGRHGFQIPVTLTDDTLDRVSVMASSGPDEHWIPLPRVKTRLFNRSARQTREIVSSMRGYLETVTQHIASGWAFDPDSPEKPVNVKAVLDGRVIGKARADVLRKETGKALGTAGFHGFRIPVNLTAGKPDQVSVSAYSETHQDWVPLPKIKPRGAKRPARPYQSIAGKQGSSDSAGKLAALNLDMLQRPGTKLPLKGFSVLDIGCNEGFFCLAALELGAASVTGIDKNKTSIERARQHCPEGNFIHGSWWDLPNEQFDLIFFLSSLHYEPREKRLLDELARHLKPEGVLVLECGVVHDGQGAPGWRQVKRGDGPKRYATMEHMMHNLLGAYVARRVAKSVDQKGDPVPRYVFHCRPRRPMALLIGGRSKSGKTTLADKLASQAIPTFRTDQLFGRLIGSPLYENTILGAFTRGLKTRDFAALSRAIVAHDHAADLARLIAAEIPADCPLFCIEGEVLTYEDVLTPLTDELNIRGIDVWNVIKQRE